MVRSKKSIWTKLVTWAVALSFIVIPFWALRAFCDSICDQEIGQEVLSPDGKWKAVSSVENCGATVAYSSLVAILPSDWKVAHGSSRVYHAYHARATADCSWTDASHLTIRQIPDSEVILKLNTLNGISIKFEK